ncbi:hypothetical protein PM082_018708 [Marasmius tenuissimus]|nr:hypothetical protein PM082_018708 [Marasmius tenuissimus]
MAKWPWSGFRWNGPAILRRCEFRLSIGISSSIPSTSTTRLPAFTPLDASLFSLNTRRNLYHLPLRNHLGPFNVNSDTDISVNSKIAIPDTKTMIDSTLSDSTRPKPSTSGSQNNSSRRGSGIRYIALCGSVVDVCGQWYKSVSPSSSRRDTTYLRVGVIVSDGNSGFATIVRSWTLAENSVSLWSLIYSLPLVR